MSNARQNVSLYAPGMASLINVIVSVHLVWPALYVPGMASLVAHPALLPPLLLHPPPGLLLPPLLLLQVQVLPLLLLLLAKHLLTLDPLVPSLLISIHRHHALG